MAVILDESGAWILDESGAWILDEAPFSPFDPAALGGAVSSDTIAGAVT